MKVKTSITISPRTIELIDEIAAQGSSRSQVIETAVIEYVERHLHRVREARDLELLNRGAATLNREVEDILGYQAEP